MVDLLPALELRDLVKLPVAAKWRQLGLQLGVPHHRLLQIQANNQHSPDFAQECLTEMLDWWLNNGPTHEKLACALIAIGKGELAKQFQVDGEISQLVHVVIDQSTSGEISQLVHAVIDQSTSGEISQIVHVVIDVRL